MVDRWEQLNRVFSQAAELAPERREPFLRTACGDDVALHAEISALLQADALSGGDRFITGTIAAAIEASLESLEPSRRGHLVGPYRLLTELGHGGMGTVYLAERVDDAYRAQVAIKFVQGGLASPVFRERFRNERQILADLAHPNIARLLDGGTAEDGSPFLVMERVTGQPIGQYCETHRLTIPARIELFLKVAAAVQFAHQLLVVHRDLKPSNILVTRDGEPKLLDFGIATLLTDEPATAETTALRLMTPAFASPEQVQGARITVSADVYSLGSILYLLLTGREVFNLRGLSAAAVERRICEEEPELPSRALARAGGPADRIRTLAGDLDTIVMKALRKDPTERFPSVAALAEDLRRYLAGEPVLAQRDTFGYRLRKRIRRHRLGFATAAAILLATAGIVGFYTSRVARERDRARLEAAKADEVATFLQGLFEVSDPARSRGGTITARELLDQGGGRIQALAGQPEVQATMMRVIGEVYSTLGLSNQARPLLEQALSRHEALFPGPNAEVATSQIAYAVLLQDQGDVAAAEPLFRAALATRRHLYGALDARVAESLSHLADLVESTGDQAQAESLLTEALAVNRKLHPPGHPLIAASLVRLGGLLRRMTRLKSAEPLLREGLAAQRTLLGNEDLAVASTARNLASLLRDKGEYDQAEPLYLEALTIRRKLLGNGHPEVANTLNSYAILLQEKGDVDGAIAAYTEFIGLLDSIHTQPHPSQAAAYNNLATVLRDQGRYDEAEALFRRSIRIQDRMLAMNHPNRAHPLIGLGSIRMRQKRYADAERFFRQAVTLRRAGLTSDHRDLGAALTDLGGCLIELRRYRPAESALLEGYQILLQSDGAEGSRTRLAARRLVALYQAWDRPDQAERYRLQEPTTPAEPPPETR